MHCLLAVCLYVAVQPPLPERVARVAFSAVKQAEASSCSGSSVEEVAFPANCLLPLQRFVICVTEIVMDSVEAQPTQLTAQPTNSQAELNQTV